MRLKGLQLTPRFFKAGFAINDVVESFGRISFENPSRLISNRFLDIYQFGNKEAILKERARLKDEMSRGYFADISEMKQHGGKIASANKIIVPITAALKFPTLQVCNSDRTNLKLPITSDGRSWDVPKASLLCLSFRATSQGMVDSWTLPFLNTFGHSKHISLYEVSFIDSWLLCSSPIKKLLLKIMKKPKPAEASHHRHLVYSFGDHYHFRKELKILNLLTGYFFLVDDGGRIRWQGFGSATEEEVSSLLACTSILLQEE
ncbi:hypothetical protein M569_00916 [Genlisea aurea]|uniref:AT1G08220-like protein n=1 Tax=Genlisea aurea TaxID=192259 RepID=S8ED36_9LAMI|nr:hypothetical protein M569_00916 [Genlisea aurea]